MLNKPYNQTWYKIHSSLGMRSPRQGAIRLFCSGRLVIIYLVWVYGFDSRGHKGNKAADDDNVIHGLGWIHSN